MLKLAGFTDTDARADRILALEHAIAQNRIAAWPRTKTFTRPTTPGRRPIFRRKPADWTGRNIFAGAGLSQAGSFIVWQPEAFTGESALVASTPLDTWKDWLAFHLIEAYAGVLPKALVEERFAFFGKVLSGTTEQRPRWQRGVFVVNGLLGDAVGQVYAQRYFSPEAKAKAQAMVANIDRGFSQAH